MVENKSTNNDNNIINQINSTLGADTVILFTKFSL